MADPVADKAGAAPWGLLMAFPAALREEVSRISPRCDYVCQQFIPFVVLGEELIIPVRMSLAPGNGTPSGDAGHSIVSAIACLDPSGYERERGGRDLCAYPSVWAAAYLSILIRDYVPEIPAMLEQELGPEWDAPFAELAAANPSFRRYMTSRIISYWHLYGKTARSLAENPACVLAKRFGLWEPSLAPRSTRPKG